MRRGDRPMLLPVVFSVMMAVPAAAADRQPTAVLQVRRSEIKVAESTWLRLTATAPQGWRIRLPEAPEALQDLRVSATIQHRYIGKQGVQHAVMRWQVESWLPGNYRIGPMEVRFSPPPDAGEGRRLEPQVLRRATGIVALRVQSAFRPFEPRRMRDINGEVRVPWGWPEWAVAMAAVVATVVGGWLFWTWMARRARSGPARQRRLWREIDQLDQARLAGSLSPDRLIVSLADVVRQSLRLREGTHPRFRTTEEWIRHVEDHQFGRDVAASAAVRASRPEQREPDSGSANATTGQAVACVLRTADAVKFAGRDATLDDARRCLTAARTVVRGGFEPSGNPSQGEPQG